MGTGYVLSHVFGRTVGKYGPAVAFVILILFTIICVVSYYLKTKIDDWRKGQDEKRAAARADKMAEGQLVKNLMDEIKETRKESRDFMSEHMKEDKEDREKLGNILSDINVKDALQVEALKEMTLDMRAHREEEKDRAGKMYEHMNEIKIEIAKIQPRPPHA